MKLVLLYTFLQIIFLVVGAQENISTMTINTLNNESGKLISRSFKYEAFEPGKVIFKDASTAEGKLNYSLLSGKMLFLHPKGDSLELAHPETFKHVIVGIDTFYFYENKYLELITHYPVNNLAINQTITMIGKEKKGAYGTYSGVSASNSNTTYTNDDQITIYLNIDENAVYKFNNAYFITDKYNNFIPADKKGFYKVFFVHEQEVRNFLKDHPVNFNNLEDLKDLLNYAKSLY